MHSRPTHPGDWRAGQQVQLRAGRVLLLVLRGAAVLPLREPAVRAAAGRARVVPARGGARAHLLRALPGPFHRHQLAPNPPPHTRGTPRRPRRLITDSLDTVHASSECARFEVIVLR